MPYLTGEAEKSPRVSFIYCNDDQQVVALRYDNWKIVFAEQREPGTMRVWSEPFVTLRVPKSMFNLRTDPFERADITSITYYDWLVDHVYLLVPAQAYIGEFLQTFRQYPQRQKAASFNLDDALLQAAGEQNTRNPARSDKERPFRAPPAAAPLPARKCGRSEYGGSSRLRSARGMKGRELTHMAPEETRTSPPADPADEVRAFYDSHPHPAPIDSLDRHRDLYQNPDRRRAVSLLLWPTEQQRANREILVAGCGTSQSAIHALREPDARVTAIDVSETSLRYTRDLQQKYGWPKPRPTSDRDRACRGARA